MAWPPAPGLARLAAMTQSADWMAAARVVRRLGFGATGTQVDAVVASGIDSYLQRVLAPTPAPDRGVDATPAPHFGMLARVPRTASATVRKKVQSERSAQTTQLVSWWTHRMIAAEVPEREKLTFMWHNHFATSIAKVGSAAEMLAQNEKLRTMGLGQFRPLAYTMLTDAAMLRWLDGASNVKGAANENLAREFMELFALGHGNGYTETDVREGARALTGWRPDNRGGTVLKPALHDSGIKTVLGVTGDLDAASFCDAVLDHPTSAGYVATRVWQHLAGDTPPSAAALTRLTSAYGPDRDLRGLVAAIVTDPELGNSSGVASPVQWLIGATRALQPKPGAAELKRTISTLKTLGQQPFYPPDVGGWPSGQAWLSTAGAETRWNAATRLARDAQVTTIHDAAAGERIDAAAHLLGVGGFSDRTVKVMQGSVKNPVTLTGIALNSPEYLTV